MTDQPNTFVPDRSTRTAQFFARFNRYKNLLRKRWWVLPLCMLVALAGEGAYLYYAPPSFFSVGRMIVSIKLSIPEGSVYTEELSNFLGTQAALMQSSVVLNRAQKRVLARNQDWATLEPDLKVSVSPRTTIFNLRVTADDPDYARAFLQASMEEYTNLKKEMREQTSDSTLANLTEDVSRIEGNLRKGEQDLVNFQSSNSIVFLQEQGNSAGNRLALLNAQVEALKSEYELLKSLTLEQNLEREQQKEGLTPLNEGLLQDLASKASIVGLTADYFKAKQQILMLKAEQQELSEFLRPKHPKMIALSEDIARRERLLGIYREQNVEQLDSKKKSIALQIENLKKDITEWEKKALQSSKAMAEYKNIQSNYERTQKLYDRLLATMQTLDVNKGINPENVTIMETASPAMLDRPGLVRSLALAAAGGLILGLVILLFVDRLDDRMSSFTEMQELFDETILGQIPREKSLGKNGDLALLQPADTRHAFLESYRNLRSSLLFGSENGQRPRILLVTSSIPNDGKSITTANLAINMAQAGSRVLLVDGDLRKGTLHSRFNLESQPGLSEVLAGHLPWKEAVKGSTVSNLSLLPRGESTYGSSELLLSQATEKLLKEAAGAYDYVLVDSPPVMAADDVSSLAPHVDGVIFVVRAEHTSARVARAALDLLYQRQAHVLGVVFNAVRASTGEYYYYRYKDYYKTYPAA